MDNERLDALFEQALAVPAPERASWVALICGGDLELRRELERLLAADAIPEGVLEHRPELLASTIADAAEIPERFGVWRVLGALGAGGMGEVWLAERSDGEFEQRAAIKQVAWPSPNMLRRFRNERQILARLEHPGIARLIDGGVDDNGCPWLAMEFVEGIPITQWVRKRALGPRAIVELLLPICDAVQFAHRNLVVHSDIKPSNILVADGVPKLLDFGIAKVLARDDTEQTRTMAQLLTPDYAAPELLVGGAITTSVDVYALGILLYELLAGAKPYHFARDGNRRQPFDDVSPKPPSAAVPGEIPHASMRRRMLHGDLDRIVLTAMARESTRRYASVEALAGDLRNWLTGRAINARRQGPWYRFGKFVRRNRIAVATASTAVLLLAIACAVSLVQTHEERVQASRAEAVRNFMLGVFANTDPTQNLGTEPTARSLLDAGARRLAAQFRENPEIDAALSRTLAVSYAGIGSYDRARPLALRALKLRRDIDGENSPTTLDARITYAEILQASNAFQEARKQAGLVLAGTQDATNEVSARAHTVLGLSAIATGNYASARTDARRALSQARAIHAIDLQAQAWDMLAQSDLGSGDFQHAQSALSQSATLYAQSRGAVAAQTLDARENLIFVLIHSGQPNRGLQMYGRLVADEQRALGSSHPRTIQSRCYYADLLWDTGHYAQARSLALQALRDLSAAREMPAPQRYMDLDELAILARDHGDLAGALRLIAQIEPLFASGGANTRYQLQDERLLHASIDAERGDANALPRLETLQAQRGRSLNWVARFDWPRAWLALGKPQEALGAYRKLEAGLTKSAQRDKYLARALTGEGIALTELGRFDEARKNFDAALAASANKPELGKETAAARLWRGWSWIRQGRASNGIQDVESTLGWYEGQFGEHSYFTAEARLAHAEALARLGRRNEASRERAQAQALFAVQLSPAHVLSRRAQSPLPHP
jgi:eukaryotic-like serine/threonine-protein kinase